MCLSQPSVRLTAAFVLSVAMVSCAAPPPGTSPAGAATRAGAGTKAGTAAGTGPGTGTGTAGQGPITGPPPSPSTVGPGVYMTDPPAPDTALPTTSIPAGCSSGTVAITHLPAETEQSAVCVKPGARLRLTLPGQGLDGWYPLQVTPEGAAAVRYTTAPPDTLAAIVTPAGTAPFCLSTGTRSLASQAAYGWRLCVTVRR